MLESEPIKLPDGAVAGTGLDHHRAGKLFSARGWLVSGSVVLHWRAGSRYFGGTRPTGEILKEATKDAAGEARVSLETGKFETKLDAKMAAPGTGLFEVAKLPRELQEVAQKEMWQAGVVIGPRAYGQIVRNKAKGNLGGGIFGGLLSASSWAMKSVSFVFSPQYSKVQYGVVTWWHQQEIRGLARGVPAHHPSFGSEFPV